MKTIPIPYGRSTQGVEVDENRLHAVLQPQHANAAEGDQSAVVQQA